MSVGAEIFDSFLVKIVAAFVAPILAAIVFWCCRGFYDAWQALHYAKQAIAGVERRIVDGIDGEGPGFWLRKSFGVRPKNYDDLRGNSIPILMIAATKGGVGKTSLTGSLAAHFAMRWTQRRQNASAAMPLRVLVIDQDFQASFSLMTVDENGRLGAMLSKSNQLVSGELGDGRAQTAAEPISRPGMVDGLSIWTIPANYDLAQAENRMMIKWLLPIARTALIDRLLQALRVREAEKTQTTDLRYVLAEALLHPRVQISFDVILIDSPPRLTTAHVQAMCAATHLLVPTILDGLSSDAVNRYLDQVATHKLGPPGDRDRAICPHLQPIGIVCTMVPPFRASLDGKLNVLQAKIAAGRLQPPIVPQDCFIRQRTPYRDHAGERIAYAATSQNAAHAELRDEVDRLGDWLSPKIGANAIGWLRRE